MGIKGLTTAVKRFASQEQLQGRVVIDGPALAYHILHLASQEAGASTILECPTYAVLGATTTRWLDSLQSHGIEVAAIYFDGALPSSKREERHQRSCQRSLVNQKYFLGNASGVHRKQATRVASWDHSRSIPDPPFFVPSILETLRAHHKYGLLTHLVPGEADPYCANDVKNAGGLLLTSDSDLLLYDLGPSGGVVFLNDVRFDYRTEASEATTATTFIKALIYRQRALCERLSLEPCQRGMLQLGFEVATNPSHWNNTSSQKSWACHKHEHAAAYAAFASVYHECPELPSAVHGNVGFLDPRIAEFVLDWPGIPANEALAVWLPFLIDRWDQESAWNMSTTIRQIAYSLCRDNEGTQATVMEYKRSLSTRSAGQPVELAGRSEVLEGIKDLIAYVDRFFEGTSTTNHKLQWVTACLGLEIGYAAQGGKDSNALKLWLTAAKKEGAVDPGTWDAVHLAALIQGTLYSFRMLSQVLRSGTGMYLPSGLVARLEKSLFSLPSIAEFPSAVDMGALFEHLHQSGHLAVLSEATGTADIPFGRTAKRPKTSNTQQKKVTKQERNQLEPHFFTASSNPFDALSRENQM